MRRFAFILHPLRFDDFARKYPFTRYLPQRLVESAFKHVNPVLAGHVTGVRSLTGEELEGWLIGLPLTPEIILNSPYDWVLKKLERAGKMAEDLGAEILGLGAFTKIAGDRGVTLAERLQIPVTTGNSYTTATAVEGTLAAAERMGITLPDAQVTVLGATGSIGRATCFVLAPSIRRLRIVARHQETLDRLAYDLAQQFPQLSVETATNARTAVHDADIVVAVSSAPGAIIEPEDLKPGAVITDVARPRNISSVVTKARPDVLVLDGGVIEVPGDQADMGFNFGFPPKMVEACMAETMILALSSRLENFTIGAEIEVPKVEEIHRLGKTHGFHLAGFRRFERAIDASEIELIRKRAQLGEGQQESAADKG
ncbi:MAG: shikimate dehydrogenase [Sulfobacillus thermosulfidooxidans]|uniref:Shikimate dehydrogenase n=1 Tax=Sulfobacillus thermotolerans TaxID=338644 RepID=A0ABM6RPX5_9FIRM|nr:shikimate dehydrogenase [Sulfobacillus sp. hq2]AUW93369.1 shikimate dehydrogenase [Sulfobacillus thermotolerans]MCY0907002.1 shikimate dehydrogenase [Sulfobacillus thermotolerans]POB10601.1 shikimate dehydrogenase [Sulfobacillus sp. hq2]PSR36239.1 MAG: shikimate dehydrogenase [Sulfobacillus thermosulfidooxidans]